MSKYELRGRLYIQGTPAPKVKQVVTRTLVEDSSHQGRNQVLYLRLGRCSSEGRDGRKDTGTTKDGPRTVTNPTMVSPKTTLLSSVHRVQTLGS